MDSEGSPVALDISGHFLCVASSSGYVKLWDVANRYSFSLTRVMRPNPFPNIIRLI